MTPIKTNDFEITLTSMNDEIKEESDADIDDDEMDEQCNQKNKEQIINQYNNGNKH